MAAKIFKNAMTVGLAVFLLSVALFMGMLYQYFGDQLTRELATEAAMVAQGVETTGRDYLDTLNVSSRVTWVDKDGTVLYDSESDPGTMDNHSQRDEVIAARKYGLGESVRYSDTLTEKTVYCAVRLDSGDILLILMYRLQPLQCCSALRSPFSW